MLVGKQFWGDVVNIKGLSSYGVISPEEAEACTVVETAEEAWDVLAKFYKIK